MNCYRIRQWTLSWLVFLTVASFLLNIFIPYAIAETEVKTYSLEECINLALRQSPSAILATQDLQKANSAFQQVTASQQGELNATAGYSHKESSSSTATDIYSGALSFSNPRFKTNLSLNSSPGESQNLNLSLQYTLYDGYPGGRGQANYEKAEQNWELQQLSWEKTRQDIVFSVKQAYFTLIQEVRMLEVNAQTIQQLEKQLEQAKEFYKAGTAPKMDITQAEMELANANLDRLRSLNSLRAARMNLNILLGLDISTPIQVVEDLKFTPIKYDLNESLPEAYQKRIELKQLEFNKRAGEVNLNLAKSDKLPTITINSGYGWQEVFYPSPLEKKDWNLGVTVNIPILDSGLRNLKIEEAQMELHNLGIREEQTKITIRQEVEQAITGLEMAAASKEVIEQALAQTQENYRLTQERYKAGLAPVQDVLSAGVSLAKAQINLVKAICDYKIAEAKIDKVLGR
jgi:outer membrane protein TolC